MKEGAIFNYTRFTNCTCKFRRLATLYFVARQVGHKRVIHATEGSTCNATMLQDKLKKNVARITVPLPGLTTFTSTHLYTLVEEAVVP